MTAKPELRLALGMRGGVSLAVWMGGACSEIDSLRRALEKDGDPIYRRLLEANGYGSVAVDVVAGASAGGLNSVLMGVSVVHGVRFNQQIRNLWLQLGDIGKLVRREGTRPPVSPLDGDRSFYGQLAPKLRTLVPAPVEDRPTEVPRLDAILTCTLFTPTERTRYQDLGPPIVEGRNRAWFRFQSRPGNSSDQDGDDELTGFGAGTSSEADLAALDRVAYAARATSSFPGAFEPASIGFAPTSGSPAPEGKPLESPLPPTHYGSYSESRSTGADHLDRDFVIDGGVLDNIPVAWAVRSIAAAPANRVVDRWLLYLQPIPFARPEKPTAARPDMLDTIDRARDLQGGTERLADDLDALERLNGDTRGRQGLQQVLEYALGQVPTNETLPEFMTALYERALASADSYRDRAGAMEAARIRALWIDPLPVFGADPLSFAGVTRDPLDAAQVPLLRRLPRVGRQLVLGPDVEDGPPVERLAGLLHRLRSPQALARTVSVLLDAARELDDAGLSIKDALYDVRTTIELVIARADRALAAGPKAHPVADDEQLVDMIRRTVWAPENPPENDWPERKELWEELVQQAQALATAAKDRENRAFIGCLVGAARNEPEAHAATEAVLAAVELLTGPLRSDPLAETTHVRFHMISARNQSELVLGLKPAPSLMRRTMTALGLVQQEPPDPDEDGLPVGAKLAGNQIKNFGAFLSARWRLNDWTWGRMDAARSLVDVATSRSADPGRPDPIPALREAFGPTPDSSPDAVRAEIVRRLHDRILREELPVLKELSDGPPDNDLTPAAFGPDVDLRPGVKELLAIGAEKPQDLILRNVLRLPDLARLAGVGGYAFGSGHLMRLTTRLRHLLPL
jgi:patatin-related protein